MIARIVAEHEDLDEAATAATAGFRTRAAVRMDASRTASGGHQAKETYQVDFFIGKEWAVVRITAESAVASRESATPPGHPSDIREWIYPFAAADQALRPIARLAGKAQLVAVGRRWPRLGPEAGSMRFDGAVHQEAPSSRIASGFKPVRAVRETRVLRPVTRADAVVSEP